METDKLVYDVDYQGPLEALVDWIAGGNFDGYIYKTYLRFSRESNTVVSKCKIVDQTAYDDHREDWEQVGTFSFDTVHGAITCTFEKFTLRGRILGDRNQYIAFSSYRPEIRQEKSICYELLAGVDV